MYMDTYENTMPVPEVPPGPSSPVSYGLDPMGHYQSLNPYLGGPEMMPVSGATSTSTSPHPASVPHPEMPQAGWYDPQQQNMHYRDGQIHGVPLNHQ
ncbi:hypothetical protein KEM55_005736 [Ascosphaera atra]|nr:hypothetical protein KEM55_005736 [Ascosphaera atra]